MEKSKGFSNEIFFIIMNDKVAMEIKIAASIAFKNFIKRNWATDDFNEDKISQDDREFIKANIVDLMLRNPPMIQNQLSEAVSIIGKSDFPANWMSLLPQLICKIKEGNFNIINGVLRTCHSLFKRYRFESRSNELWIEIKEVISKLGEPLALLIQQTMSLIDQHSTDKTALSILWNSILSITKIFLSLNHQDLPEYFEDTMSLWMGHFHQILLVTNPLLNTDDNEEIGILEQVKSQICDIISLYARNYDEEFSKYIGVFIEDILKVLVSTTSAPKYDSLVANALHFLSLVADRTHHRELFVEKIDLQHLSQNIIIPNIEFQESDQELFIDNPDEYIRRDIEGSHSDTRRKSACELVKSLCRLFEQQVVSNFVMYIQELLKRYMEDSTQNWKMKDSAMFLITSVASRGETGRHGVTATTEFVDIMEFYKMHVLPELQGTMKGNPVIKADCIKYLMTFRSIIPAEELRTAVNLLISFAGSPLHVVHSYAAAAINKLLMVRDPASGAAVISADHISHPTAFITTLWSALSVPGSEDNAHVMQATMRALSTLQHRSMDCMNPLVESLLGKLDLVVKNPRRPLFNHSLLESIALCIRIVCGMSSGFVTSFESMLCPTLNSVLKDDVEEFVPYAFQLFSMMLDQHPAGQITESYQELFPFLVHPALWERSGITPSLIRLLLSYLEKANWAIIANQLDNLVAIFHKLNRSRALDAFGFSLISAILLHVPRAHTEGYMRAIFVSIFQRLTQNKTPKYLRGFLLFFSGLALIYPPSELVQLIDKIQANLFRMTLDSSLVPTMTNLKIENATEKKICLVGMTRLVMESPELTRGSYQPYWAVLVTKIVEALAAPGMGEPHGAAEDGSETHFVDIEATSASTAHNQLVFVGKKVVDPAAEVRDARVYFGEKLKQLAASDPQQFAVLFNTMDAGVVAALRQMLMGVGVAL